MNPQLRRAPAIALVATLLGFALRLPLNGAVPPRWDEGWSIAHASLGLAELLTITAADVHPPLYYLLLAAWQALLGHDLFAARYLSVLLSATAIPLIYAVAVAWSGSRRLGAFAAVLMAWLPLGVYYGAVARMYALAPSLVLLAMWGALRIVRPGARAQARRCAVIAFVLGAVGAMLTLYHAVWALAAIALYTLLDMCARGSQRAALRALLGAIALSMLLYLPWALFAVPQFLGRAAAEAQTNIGQQFPIAYFLGQGVRDLTMAQELGVVGPIAIATIVVIGLAVALARRRRIWPLLLPALMIAFTLLGVAVAARQWAFNARMLIGAVPALALALAWAFDEIVRAESARGPARGTARHLPALALAGLLIALYLPTSLGLVYAKTLEVFDPYDPRIYRARIAPRAQPGDVAFFNVLSPAGFYALDRQPGDPAWSYALTWDPVIEPRARWEARVSAALADGGRAWLVLYRGLAGANGDLRGWMDTTYYPAHAEWGEEEVFYGLYGAARDLVPVAGAGARWGPLTLDDIRIGNGVTAGEIIPIALTWHAEAPVATPYKVFVHALAPDGRLIAQHDAQPVNDLRPFTTWAPGERVRDHHGLALPPDYSGPLTLVLGLYDANTGQRIVADDGRDAVVIGEVTVGPMAPGR